MPLNSYIHIPKLPRHAYENVTNYPSCYFFMNAVSAQPPAIEWQNTFGGLSAQDAYSIDQTSDGGYISCGSSPLGAMFVKMDAGGNILWTKYTQGGIPFCIQQTTDGGFITTGYGSFSTNSLLDYQAGYQWRCGLGKNIWRKPHRCCI